MVRPSASSTARMSSVTVTLVAPANSILTVEEGMPLLHEFISVLLNDTLNAAKFLIPEVSAVLQGHRAEPKLGECSVTSYMNVRRLGSIARDKVESIWALSQQDRHLLP